MEEEQVVDGSSTGVVSADSSAQPAHAPHRTRRAEVSFAILLALYAVLAVLAHYFAYFSWDLKTERAIQSIKLPGFEILMFWVSVLGSGWEPFGLVLMAGLALFAARRRVEALVCVIGSAAGSGVDTLLKEISGRPRPSEDLVHVLKHYERESFPSGHVFFYVEFFGFLFFLAYVLLKRGPLRSGVLVILGILISVVGISRVYLGAHWPSDVVGAYLAGGIWLILMIEVCRRIQARRQNGEA
jgi:membrane-associated phospholipid phosphatase